MRILLVSIKAKERQSHRYLHGEFAEFKSDSSAMGIGKTMQSLCDLEIMATVFSKNQVVISSIYNIVYTIPLKSISTGPLGANLFLSLPHRSSTRVALGGCRQPS